MNFNRNLWVILIRHGMFFLMTLLFIARSPGRSPRQASFCTVCNTFFVVEITDAE